MQQGIGLCGSHRTGKTTLARNIAKQCDLEFVVTTTSEVFAANGLKPSSPMDFKTRLWIQDKIITAAEEVWAGCDRTFITDRTPLDMLAYTLGDIQGVVMVDFVPLQEYIERCIQSTNRFFGCLCVVQPGIKLVPAPGKAALNLAYIEHLNTLVLGLCADERITVPFHLLPRQVVDLQKRCDFLVQNALPPLGITIR
jgi:hypothetical protein